MEFTNQLTVQAPLELVWTFFKDIRAVVACFPGAELSEATADGEYAGTVQARVGPFRASFRGTARLVEADDAAHRLVLQARANDAKLGSKASAQITITASSQSASTTGVVIVTDLQLLGRLAQFGRGILEGVAGQMTASFAECVNRRFEAAAGGPAAQGSRP